METSTLKVFANSKYGYLSELSGHRMIYARLIRDDDSCITGINKRTNGQYTIFVNLPTQTKDTNYEIEIVWAKYN